MPIGLVLEGGGNRGTYTAGVLDVLMENNIFFPITYAVSSGACNSLSYLSKQYGRNCEIIIKYISEKRHLQPNLFRKTNLAYGFDFILGEISTDIFPLDYDEFFRTSMRLRVGTTDCRTGKPVFYDKSVMKRDFTSVIASSSLPVISDVVEYDGHELLDGGVSAPIPLDIAISDGIKKNVVILTRDKSYVKKPRTDVPLPILKKKYKNYPKFVEAMINRHKVYNDERKLCYDMQDNGDALVIQPSEPITISKYNNNPNKLKALYDMGVRDAKENLVNIRRFIALNS